VKIMDLDASDDQAIRQVASILVEGFREHWPDAWPDIQSGLDEVRESFEPGRLRGLKSR